MASPVNALICALVATALWSLVGYALGCRLVPRALAIGSAPAVGWSVHSAATLPIYLLFGFSPFLVAGIAAVCILVVGFSLSRPRPVEETECVISIPALAFAAAALVALLPAATILPKSVRALLVEPAQQATRQIPLPRKRHSARIHGSIAGIRYNRPVASRSAMLHSPLTPPTIHCKISQRSRSIACSSSGSSAPTRA
jgi:hypothetical protein